MIERITIQNFAVARDVTLEPGPGLNVYTGETGAGKSIVVDALAFAFGARRGREVIARGQDRATVTVTIRDGDETLTVERRVGQSGRATARINGDAATLEEISTLGERFVDIHSQAEQLAILRPQMQVAVLDAYAGLTSQRTAVAATVRELRALERRIEALTRNEHERERMIEQLRYEVEEIENAVLVPGEAEQLRNDQMRLASADLLMGAAAEAIDALTSPAIGEAISAAGSIAEHDPAATGIAELAAAFEAAASELTREVRHYGETVETDPEALTRVTERLDLLARLRRKYGDSEEKILQYGQEATARLADLTGATASVEHLVAERETLMARLAADGTALSTARRTAAVELVAALQRELTLLGMGGASLAVGFVCEDDADGPLVALPDYEVIDPEHGPMPAGETAPRACTENGFDRIEFQASFNPGELPRPLAAVASGGETSRFFLALTTVLSESAEPRLEVFDEVDEGVGGRSGSLVGEALARLAQRHQVFCITHLPQVAVHGGRHFVVRKRVDGGQTWSEVQEVCDEARIEEIASMLGAATEVNRAAARSLLTEATEPPAAS